MALFGLGSLILFGAVYLEVKSYLGAQSRDWLAREISGRVHSSAAERITHLDARLPTDLEQHRPFALLAPSGRLLAGVLVGHPDPPALDTAFEYSGVTSQRESITYLAMAHRLRSGELLLVAQNVDEANDFSEMITNALLSGVGVMLVIGLAGAIVLGRSSARRIDDMRLTIERIIAGHLSERLPVRSRNGDLERLAIVVNGMLGELERMVGEVKGVCDNIAHDMRTPLARLLAGLERALRRAGDREQLQEAIGNAVGEIKEILRIFAALLRISEIEDGVRRAGFEQLDVVEVARDAVEYYLPLAEARGINVMIDAPPHMIFEGDRGLLFEAMANLLDNAIKFSGENGHVALSVASGPVIRVADCGPGIPLGERPQVLNRFQRGEASRSLPGNGLGLPLIAAIADLHGLSIEIGDSSPGCVVTLHPKATV